MKPHIAIEDGILVATPPPEVMRMDDLLAYFGVSSATARQWMHRRDDPIPHMRMGRGINSPALFSKKLVDAWFERQMATGHH